jgi:branched-chain amino acid transport system permease protein
MFKRPTENGGVKRRVIVLGFVALLLIIFPHVIKITFYQHLMIMIFFYITVSGAWNILGGYAGQISFGHAAFFGIGGYTSTLLLIHFHLSPWIGMLIGAFFAVVLSLAVGYPFFKLVGHYFAIATLAMGEILFIIVGNMEGIGGGRGIILPILQESFFNFEFHKSKVPYYYIAMAFGLSMFLTTYLIERSRMGYYLKAINRDPVAASSHGVNIVRYKAYAIAISAFFTAISGSFYAQYLLYIDPPSMLSVHVSIIFCLIPIIGGAGTKWGPVIGTCVFIPLSEFTRIYFGGGGKAIDMLIYGSLLVVVSVYKPMGLVTLFTKSRGKK